MELNNYTSNDVSLHLKEALEDLPKLIKIAAVGEMDTYCTLTQLLNIVKTLRKHGNRCKQAHS